MRREVEMPEHPYFAKNRHVRFFKWEMSSVKYWKKSEDAIDIFQKCLARVSLLFIFFSAFTHVIPDIKIVNDKSMYNKM